MRGKVDASPKEMRGLLIKDQTYINKNFTVGKNLQLLDGL
jgi:hypothetical protein